jgi:hypothetical protein
MQELTEFKREMFKSLALKDSEITVLRTESNILHDELVSMLEKLEKVDWNVMQKADGMV